MKEILVIVTGGTIDAISYQKTPRKITPLKETIIPSLLNEMGMLDRCSILVWYRKDSKCFKSKDLAELCRLIKSQSQDKIIITHGTDHMVKNASFIKEKLRNTHKIVLFTGAMVPVANQMDNLKRSEGYKNLEFAISEIDELPYGVYIAFHNKILNPFKTIKNFKNKTFEQYNI